MIAEEAPNAEQFPTPQLCASSCQLEPQKQPFKNLAEDLRRKV